MALSEQRSFTTPLPGEDWPALAARVMSDSPVEDAINTIKSWNLHLLMRNPPGEFLGSDVVFTGPPVEAGGNMFELNAGEGNAD